MARTSEAQAQDLAGDTAGAVHDAEQAIEGGVGTLSTESVRESSIHS